MRIHLMLLLGFLPFFLLCALSLKKKEGPVTSWQKKICSNVFYLLACISLGIMLLLTLNHLKNTIPPYLEVHSYEVPSNSNSFFLGCDPGKCRIILTDPATDKVHALISQNAAQWGIRNVSSYRRLQFGPHNDDLNSALLYSGDQFAVDGHTFRVEHIGWFYVRITRLLPFEETRTLLHRSIMIGPTIYPKNILERVKAFFSPTIPLSGPQNRVSGILKYESGALRFTYRNATDKVKHLLYHQGKLLTHKEAILDPEEGARFVLGHTVYRMEYAQQDKNSVKKIKIIPINHRPRISLKGVNRSKLVCTGSRPLSESVLDIPFHFDHHLNIEMTNEHSLKIGGKTYSPRDIISWTNASGDRLTVQYVSPRDVSIMEETTSPIPGAAKICRTLFWIALLLSLINIFTGSLHSKTQFIYYFILLMSSIAAIIACRAAAFDFKLAQWPDDLSRNLWWCVSIFLFLSNFRGIRWFFLRMKYHTNFEVNRYAERPLDFARLFLRKIHVGRRVSIYPSTVAGTIVICLFILQKFFGTEQGISLFGGKLFQPIFISEILIVMVIAFWTQRNIEAHRSCIRNTMTSKVSFFFLINRDLIIFTPFLIVLPLYCLKDFAPFLIFSTLSLIAFCIRPTIPIRVRCSISLFIVLTALFIINYPKMLGATLASRIAVWEMPWSHTERGFQFIQNLWLLKGSGMLGWGLGGTDISVRFPALHLDFITSLFIGDMGTWGLLMLLLTWIIFLSTLFRHCTSLISTEETEHDDENALFQKSILLWIGFLFMLHTWLIIGSNLGLFPVMGIPLPFLARGFSCLVFFCFPAVAISALCVNELQRIESTRKNHDRVWGK